MSMEQRLSIVTEDELYMAICMMEIGVDIVSGKSNQESNLKWRKFIKYRSEQTVLTDETLEKLFRLVRGVTGTMLKDNLMNIEGYYRHIGVLLIHVMLFPIPASHESTLPTPYLYNKSLNDLMRLLSERSKLFTDMAIYVQYKKYWMYLLDVMMDLLEYISNGYFDNEYRSTLAGGILPFVAYFLVIVDDFRYDRNTDFLESFLSDEGSNKVFAAVILCSNKRYHRSRNVLKEYLDYEFNKRLDISIDAIVVFTVYLLNTEIDEWTKVERRILFLLTSSSNYELAKSSRTMINIFRLFDRIYNDEVLETIAECSSITECERIIIIRFLSSLLNLFDRDFRETTSPLIDGTMTYNQRSFECIEISEMIFCSFIKDYAYIPTSRMESLYKVCIKYLSKENVRSETKLSAALVICSITPTIETRFHIRKAIDHISDVLSRMRSQGSNNYSGFTQSTLLKLSSQAEKRLKRTSIIDYFPFDSVLRLWPIILFSLLCYAFFYVYINKY